MCALLHHNVCSCALWYNAVMAANNLHYAFANAPVPAAALVLQVQQDILSSLQLRNPALLVTSFNRPNIHYTVTLLDVQQPPAPTAAPAVAAASQRSRAGVLTEAAAEAAFRLHPGDSDSSEALEAPDDIDLAGYSHLLPLLKPAGSVSKHKKHQTAADTHNSQQDAAHSPAAAAGASRAWPGPVAIVYALKRSTVDVLVRRLAAEGLAVAGYHAALPDAVRAAVLERWRDGKLQVWPAC
jgi:superfamily II DNA helicase RecQ